MRPTSALRSVAGALEEVQRSVPELAGGGRVEVVATRDLVELAVRRRLRQTARRLEDLVLTARREQHRLRRRVLRIGLLALLHPLDQRDEGAEVVARDPLRHGEVGPREPVLEARAPRDVLL